MTDSTYFNLTKRTKIMTTILIAVIVVFFIFANIFSSTEIIVLDHLTEWNEGISDEICLVKNPPDNAEELVDLIERFNSSRSVSKNLFHRTFIKEHDKIYFPALTLSENIDYTSKNITRYDIDNIDLLATSHKVLDVSVKRIKETECYTGKFWYYKE